MVKLPAFSKKPCVACGIVICPNNLTPVVHTLKERCVSTRKVKIVKTPRSSR